MRAVVQRVLNAGVTVDGECVGKIGRGYLVLLGVGHGDTRAEADKLWGKLRGLRINEDENGKTNLALADVDGEVLVVSQFTLFADCRHGFRVGSLKVLVRCRDRWAATFLTATPPTIRPKPSGPTW